MGEHSSETLKIVLNYRLLDDAFFKLVAEDVGVCQEILRTILGDDGIIVLEAKAQVTEVSLHREVRIDIKCKFGNGTICNVEVQKSNRNDDIRRTRFHTSLLTVNNTSKSMKFSEIPDVIAIYISDYNVLQNGQRLTMVKRCQKLGDKYMPVDDGELIIFANTVFTNEELRNQNNMSDTDRLLMLFNRSDLFYDERFPNISKRVRYFKEDREGVDDMCTEVEEYAKRYAEKYAEERVKEVEEYAEERVKEAEEYAKQQAKSSAIKMLAKGFSIEDIIDITGLTQEQIEALKNN